MLCPRPNHCVARPISCAPIGADVVRSSVSRQQQETWQRADRGTAWQALRAPLVSAVVALFGAVAVSKPELGAASALVPTLAAGLPALLKLLLQMASAPASTTKS